MQPGDTIHILHSCTLQSMHLEDLSGKKGVVVEVINKNGKIHGCWVKLPQQYLGEDEWFIPYISIGL